MTFFDVDMGSILGMIFASFPVSFKTYRMDLSHHWQDNVGRLVVDGDNYFSSERFRVFITAFSLTSDCQTDGSRTFWTPTKWCRLSLIAVTMLDRPAVRSMRPPSRKTLPCFMILPNLICSSFSAQYQLIWRGWLRFLRKLFSRHLSSLSNFSSPGRCVRWIFERERSWDVGYSIGSSLGGFLDAWIAIMWNDGNLIPRYLALPHPRWNICKRI